MALEIDDLREPCSGKRKITKKLYSFSSSTPEGGESRTLLIKEASANLVSKHLNAFSLDQVITLCISFYCQYQVTKYQVTNYAIKYGNFKEQNDMEVILQRLFVKLREKVYA
jgi:hypothetical protein